MATIIQLGLLAGRSDEAQKRNTNDGSSEFHFRDIFKTFRLSNNKKFPNAVEKVCDAMVKLSDAMSQVSEAMGQVLTAVLSLPMAFASSTNDDMESESMTKDTKVSHHVYKSGLPCKENAPKNNLAKDGKHDLKVM